MAANSRSVSNVARPDSERGVIRALAPIIAEHRLALTGVVVLGVLTSLAESIGITLFIPLLGSVINGDAAPGGGFIESTLNRLFSGVDPDDRLAVICVAIMITVAIRAGLLYANTAVFAWLYGRTGHDLRSRLHAELMRVEYGFLVRADFGRLLHALSTETWNTTDAIAVLIKMVINACTIAVYVVLLLALGWQLTFIVGSALVAISLLVRFMTRRVGGLSVTGTTENGILANRMLEACAGAKVIRAYGRESTERARFDEASVRVSGLFRHIELLKAIVTPVYEVLAAGVLVAVLFFSLRSNPSNLASLLVFVVVLYRLQPRIKDLDDARVQLLSFAGGVSEVIGLLAATKDERVVDGDRPADDLEAGFRLEHVSMRYGPDLPLALDDVTLEIPAGRTTALVGPSGAGKSTVIDLLLRFTAPEAGRVTFGGVEVQDLQVASLRARTAMVSQDVYLFNASVRDNIAYGHEGATDADVERAARLAHAHDFITGLPEGYDTIVGEDGVRLSGGQRQRITLARAIVRDPDVLILDEATNALDSISEHMVQEAIDLLSGDRTIVVIAHRLSTISRADHVVVLDQGRVAEQGTPAELLAANGMFARLCSLQHITATEPAS